MMNQATMSLLTGALASLAAVVAGPAAQAATFDVIDDDFNRDAGQIAPGPDGRWHTNGVSFGRDASNNPITTTTRIDPNGFLRLDLRGDDVTSGNAALGSLSNTTPTSNSYTFEIRAKVEQFAGTALDLTANSAAGDIHLADIRQNATGVAGRLLVNLEANRLSVYYVGNPSGRWTPISVTTAVDTFYTWRFVVDQANQTVDIFRRENDTDAFTTLAQDVATAPQSQAAQVHFGVRFDDGSTIQPAMVIDYVHLGTGVIPEPGSLALLGAGGLMMASRRRRIGRAA